MRSIDTQNLSPALFATCGVSVEREDVLSAGLFDESFSGYGGEDEELAFRLVQNGVRIVWGADAHVWDEPLPIV